MHPTVAPAPAGILGIDLGKFKSVACRLADDGELNFETFATDRAALTAILERDRPRVVAVEACTPAGWVSDLCGELGVPCKVANTSSEAWKFKHSKRKTDRDDALRLAHLERLGQLPEVALPPAAVRQRRALIAQRQRIVSRRVAVQNRVRALLVAQGLAAPRGAACWSAAALARLSELARPLDGCPATELWRGALRLALDERAASRTLEDAADRALDALAKDDPQVKLLRTIPGMGPRTAEAVAAHLWNPKRFASGKQVSAYAGLVPRQYQSGETDRRGRITKRGPGVLRKLLVQCAWAMLRYNEWPREVWARLTNGGKTRRKQAVVALARRVLVRCWAMLRDNQPWRAEAPKKQAA